MKTPQRCPIVAVLITAALSLVAPSALAAPNPERDAFFGETHVHTSWSAPLLAEGEKPVDHQRDVEDSGG